MTEAELRQQLADAYDCDLEGTQAQIALFAEQLRNKYADWQRYRYYHILVGSTPVESQTPGDFPDADVATFLLSLSPTVASTGC